MHNDNNIEKSINEKFNGFQLEIPEDLWSKIEANLDGDKKKRKVILFWKWFGGLIFLLGLCFGINQWRSSYVSEDNDMKNTNQLVSKTDKIQFQQSKISINKKAKSDLKTSQSIFNPVEIKNQLASSGAERNPKNHNSAIVDANDKSKLISKQFMRNGNGADNRLTQTTNQNETQIDKTELNVLHSNNQLINTKQEQKIESNLSKSNVNETSVVNVDLLPMRKLTMMGFYFDRISAKPISYPKKTVKQASFWSISTSASVSDNFRKLNIPDQPELRTHRNQNEKQFVSVSYQFQVERIYRNIIFGFGYGFTKKGELYKFSSGNINHSSKNFYSYDQFQISLAKRIALKNRLLIVPGVRTNFNFLKHAHASWVDPSTFAPITHSSGGLTPFRKQVVSGELYLELTTSYKHFEYFLTPKFNMMFQSVYREGIAIKQYPFAAELGIGLRYKF